MRRLLRRAALVFALLLAAVAVVLFFAFRAPVAAIPEAGAILQDVTVVNPGLDRRTHRTLRVDAGGIERIEAARPAASGRGAEFAGAFVLPGLIDLHVHHPPVVAPGERALFAVLFLAHGVTSVRDTGDTYGSVLPHARRIAGGGIPGPRTFACGPFLDGEPAEWPTARVVANRAEARAAVSELDDAGVACIKVYNGVSAASYDAILEEADARNLPVVIHVPYRVPFERLGAVEVQHMMGLTWDWAHVQSAEIDAYVEASQAQGVTHTPTLVVFPRMAALDDYPSLLRDPLSRLLPSYYREQLWNPERNPIVLDLSPAGDPGVRNRTEVMQAAVERLHAAGVPVLAGSDTMNPFVVPGASLQEELRLLADSGIGPEEAWVAATRLAGEALRVPGLGVIREGAPADLLVFRRDPTRDLAALDSLEAVVADGRLYRRAWLDAAVAGQRSHFANPLREKLTELAIDQGLRIYREGF